MYLALKGEILEADEAKKAKEKELRIRNLYALELELELSKPSFFDGKEFKIYIIFTRGFYFC